MEAVTRTIYSGQLQNTLLLGTPYVIPKFTTLNEALGISADIAISATDVPKMRYIAIGNGGHKMVVGSNMISKPEPVQHTTTDAALYKQIPFVLRPTANDLTIDEQHKYGLKKRVSIGTGADLTEYFAYYLKKLDFTNVNSKIELKKISNGVTTTTDYVPTASNNLTMLPPNLTNTGVNVTTGDYVTASAKVQLTLDANEVTEILNAATIIFGDAGFAIISEIALCSGVDKNILFEDSGFNEVIGCQVMTFINTFFSMSFANSGINILIDVGSGEPLLTLTGTP